jgi:predicted lipid-binding transport protein (Tim44 family)
MFAGALALATRARKLHSAADWYWIIPVGGRFWVGLLGSIVAIGVAALILFLLVDAAFLRWGVLGALIFFCLIVLAIASISDRRKQARYDDV